jgi:pimeloyl-ACP methyl ester carboxylesterase
VPNDASPLAAQADAGREHLVLLHGIGESRVGWQPVTEKLSSEYEVTALDLPGFGEEPGLPAGVPYTADALADAVERRLDDLGIVEPHVAGYSLGARVGLELAARRRTRSLIAIAPDGLGTPVERVYLAVALLTGRTLAQVLEPAAATLAASPAGRSFFLMERSRPWRLTPDDALDLLREFADSPGYEPAVRAALFDVPFGVERIGCPVLFLQGTADPLVAAQTPRYLAFLPGARMKWLPGLGHVPISDDPALVARLMLDFLRAQAGRSSTGSRSASWRALRCA